MTKAKYPQKYHDKPALLGRKMPHCQVCYNCRMVDNKYQKFKLKQGRDWTVRRGHPWVFSGALNNPSQGLPPGTVVDLEDTNGDFVARGYYNPRTDIAVRVLTQDPAEEINTDFFIRRITEAWELRRRSLDFSRTDVFRLINAEGDFLPGLIADYYAGAVVLQSHTAGIDALFKEVVEAITEVIKPSGLLARSDVAVRSREGLKKEEPTLISGEIAPEIVVKENGFKFAADLWKGQKTGFYADQRDKRNALPRYATGDSLLNCFSYTGGFSVYAACCNPNLKITNVDQSQGALNIARRNFELNGLDTNRHEFLVADAFTYLQAQPGQFDTVVLDPPAFAKSHRDKDKALQGYLRLNSLGLPLVKSGGFLMTCSCSGSVTMEEFSNFLSQAAAATRRRVQILETFENGPDHPVNIFTPESRYLKVMVCRVL